MKSLSAAANLVVSGSLTTAAASSIGGTLTVGDVSVTAGSLYLSSGSSSGALSVSSGSTLSIGGSFSLAGVTSISGAGTVDLGSYTGVTTVACSYSVDTTIVSGGEVDFNTNVTMQHLTLHNSGVLAGSGTFTVDQDGTWYGSSNMGGSGTTVISGGATLTILGGGYYASYLNRTLDNHGTIVFGSPAGQLSVTNGGLIHNESGATIDFQSDGSINAYYGARAAPALVNDVIQKSAATTVRSCSVDQRRSGQVNVETGTLTLQRAHRGCTFTSAPTTPASTHTREHNVRCWLSITGAGTINFASGTSLINGTIRFLHNHVSGACDFESSGVTTGNLTVSGGTLILAPPRTSASSRSRKLHAVGVRQAHIKMADSTRTTRLP